MLEMHVLVIPVNMNREKMKMLKNLTLLTTSLSLLNLTKQWLTLW